MLDLGGSFAGFMDTLMGFISQLLTSIFTFLQSFIGGININVS